MADVCLFCENPADTAEHVWPDWLNGVLPNYADTGYWHQTEDGTREWISKRAANITAKIVCERCNSGWMSGLEVEAQALLTEPIRGRKITWDAPQQRAIARWAFKTAIIWEQLNPSQVVIPRETCFSIRGSERPPLGLHVFTAAIACFPRDTMYHDYRLAIATPAGFAPDGYLATFAIGRLAMQVIWTEFEQAVFAHQGELTTAVRRIWPFDRSFTWPGGKIMSYSTFGMLAEHWRDRDLWTFPFDD